MIVQYAKELLYPIVLKLSNMRSALNSADTIPEALEFTWFSTIPGLLFSLEINLEQNMDAQKSSVIKNEIENQNVIHCHSAYLFYSGILVLHI